MEELSILSVYLCSVAAAETALERADTEKLQFFRLRHFDSAMNQVLPYGLPVREKVQKVRAVVLEVEEVEFEYIGSRSP